MGYALIPARRTSPMMGYALNTDLGYVLKEGVMKSMNYVTDYLNNLQRTEVAKMGYVLTAPSGSKEKPSGSKEKPSNQEKTKKRSRSNRAPSSSEEEDDQEYCRQLQLQRCQRLRHLSGGNA